MRDRAKVTIDSAALRHNFHRVKEMAPRSKILAMVKSNAYGHGLLPIAQGLAEVDGFGVACIDEAVSLREKGIQQPIVIMSGVFTPEDIKLVQHYDLHIVIHDNFQIKLIKSCEIHSPLNIWLKIDTGMHRLGFPKDQFKEVYKDLASHHHIQEPMVVMTHLADADNMHKDTTPNQLEIFHQQTATLNCPKSIANSAGIIAWPNAISNWNRPGIILYGISPMQGKVGADHGLLPVMTLTSKIIAIHDLKAGDAIGYGGIWTCPEDMRIGVVAIGYGDGYPRHAKNGTPTLIGGKNCSLVGRVSMDLITVDLRSCPQANINDEVVLWGKDLPVEIVANYADTIPYQLTCNISQRVIFNYQ